MKKLLYLLLLPSLVTACDKLPENGVLDGQWQLKEMHPRQRTSDTDNRQTDVSLQRIYWSFQLKLLNINGRGLNLFCRFNHHNGQLDIPEVYRHLFANDILITDPTTTELEPVGIRGNATSYKVIRLNRTQLILVSEADSLVFRKIAL